MMSNYCVAIRIVWRFFYSRVSSEAQNREQKSANNEIKLYDFICNAVSLPETNSLTAGAKHYS